MKTLVALTVLSGCWFSAYSELTTGGIKADPGATMDNGSASHTIPHRLVTSAQVNSQPCANVGETLMTTDTQTPYACSTIGTPGTWIASVAAIATPATPGLVSVPSGSGLAVTALGQLSIDPALKIAVAWSGPAGVVSYDPACGQFYPANGLSPCTSLSSSPTSIWLCNEGTGTSCADSGPGPANPLTLIQGAVGLPFWTTEGGKGTLHFIGGAAAQETVVPVPTVRDLAHPFSFSFWMHPDNANDGILIDNQDPAKGYTGIEINQRNGAHVQIKLHGADFNNGIVMQSSTVLSLALHHIVVTYDGTRTAAGAKIYIDNVLDTPAAGGQDNLTTVAHSTLPLSVGNGTGNTGGSGLWFSGVIADVRSYTAAITVAQVNALFTGGLQ